MLPSLGIPELMIVLVVILVVFGPGKLPSVGAALGKGVREFKRGAEGEEPAASQAAEIAAPEADHKPV